MTKTLAEATMTTKSARAKLAAGVHWRGIDSDVHLGYRKGKRAGRWLVRWYEGSGKYRQEAIASADDVFDADGKDCLSFEQAKAAAVQRVRQRRADAIASAAGPAQTVRTAVQTYIEARNARETAVADGRRVKKDASNRLHKHVLAQADLADTALHALTETALTDWKDALGSHLAAASVKRLVNDFKAALNAAGAKCPGSAPMAQN